MPKLESTFAFAVNRTALNRNQLLPDGDGILPTKKNLFDESIPDDKIELTPKFARLTKSFPLTAKLLSMMPEGLNFVTKKLVSGWL
jgi:hypothetical protein